ncbi:MAG: hypothetical protein AAF821_17470 [Cyanobacteria bacterium P01_D01_bin.156]
MTCQKWPGFGKLGLLFAIAFPLIISPTAQAGQTIIIRRTERSGHHHPTIHEGHRHRIERSNRHNGRQYRRTRGRHHHTVYEEHRHGRQRHTVHNGYRRREVTVEFIAQGNEWANVYVNGRLVFSPTNANRRKTFTLREGAYELKITGVDYFDIWAEGYLDIGRDNSNVVVVAFSERGVRTVGDTRAWIPVATGR